MDCRYTSNLASDLGRIPYLQCLHLQKNLVGMVRTGIIPGIVLFLEHDPVYTIGRKADPANYPDIEVIRTERGGDVTYHGPGQLVIYPILKIGSEDRIDVRQYVTKIEDVVISALGKSGYKANIGDEPGIWVHTADGDKKVASLGMAIDHGISFHGVAINFTSDPLSWFSAIRPCGLSPSVMGYVSIQRDEMISHLLEGFTEYFGNFSWIDREELTEIADIKL